MSLYLLGLVTDRLTLKTRISCTNQGLVPNNKCSDRAFEEITLVGRILTRGTSFARDQNWMKARKVINAHPWSRNEFTLGSWITHFLPNVGIVVVVASLCLLFHVSIRSSGGSQMVRNLNLSFLQISKLRTNWKFTSCIKRGQFWGHCPLWIKVLCVSKFRGSAMCLETSKTIKIAWCLPGGICSLQTFDSFLFVI